MPTPLNQTVADSALLTKSLPLGLLRAFVQIRGGRRRAHTPAARRTEDSGPDAGTARRLQLRRDPVRRRRHLHGNTAARQRCDCPQGTGRPAQHACRRHFRTVAARPGRGFQASRRGPPGGFARGGVRHGIRARTVPVHRVRAAAGQPGPARSRGRLQGNQHRTEARRGLCPHQVRRPGRRGQVCREGRGGCPGPRTVLHCGRLRPGPVRGAALQGRCPGPPAGTPGCERRAVRGGCRERRTGHGHAARPGHGAVGGGPAVVGQTPAEGSGIVRPGARNPL